MHLKSFITLLFIVTFTYSSDIPNVAIKDLSGDGFTKSELNLLSSRLRMEFLNTGAYHVMERNEMKAILEEMNFQQSVECVESACIVEMGQVLGVTKMIAGTVGKIDNLYTIMLRVIDIRTGAIDKAVSYDFQGTLKDFLTIGLKNAAYKLVEKNSGNRGKDFAFVTIDSKPTNANMTINDSIKVALPYKSRLPLGDYKLNLSLEGYKPLSKTISLKDTSSFSDVFRLKSDKKSLKVTKIVSGIIGAAALASGLVFNKKADDYDQQAQDLLTKSEEEGDPYKYNDEYEASKNNAEQSILYRNISYSLSAVSFTVFAVSFAF